jgi:DNA-binding CsgD family transcriptional regulator
VSSDRLKAVGILADASLSAYGAGHPAISLQAAAKAIDLLQPGDPAEYAVCALVAYGALAILAGRGAEGSRRLRESAALFEKVSLEGADPLLLMCAGIAGLFIRETKAQRDLLDRAVDQAREHAPAAALPSILLLLGRDAAATDRWPLARAHYEEAARVARETTQFTWLAGAIAGLAWLDALEGKEGECRVHAAEGRVIADQYGMGFFTAWSMIALGQLELGQGRPEAALQHFTECSVFLERISIDDPDLSPQPDMVDALVRVGRVDEAREAAELYWRTAQAKGQPFALARGSRARALVASDDAFAAEFESALRHHDAASDVFERARTCLYFGERLRRARRRLEARRQLRAALKVFENLGASPWADRALAELQASGETARVRDDRHRQQLTPQELQVALTLADGATTRGAAARLYVSPKTIEYHLRHVYDKLEIRNRDELRTYFSGSPRTPDGGAGRLGASDS